jgi:hypothetical protein
MNYRQPNFNELFPLSCKKQLLDMQSTHFINNSLAKGGITAGFEGLPTSIPFNETLDNEVIKNKIAEALVGTYFKNNWKVMLACGIVGGALIYVVIKINQENQKRKFKNNYFSNPINREQKMGRFNQN